MAGVADTQLNKVLDYNVDFKTVLGKRAMGIVHPVNDKKGNKVAAKCIDYRDKSRGENIAKELENISRLKFWTHLNSHMLSGSLWNSANWEIWRNTFLPKKETRQKH